MDLKPEDCFVEPEHVLASLPGGREWLIEFVETLTRAVDEDEELRDGFMGEPFAVGTLFQMKPLHVYGVAALLMNQLLVSALSPAEAS